jgi:hypothetical protein
LDETVTPPLGPTLLEWAWASVDVRKIEEMRTRIVSFFMNREGGWINGFYWIVERIYWLVEWSTVTVPPSGPVAVVLLCVPSAPYVVVWLDDAVPPFGPVTVVPLVYPSPVDVVL